MLRTLILPMTDKPPRTGALAVGTSLAKALTAHVSGLFIRPDPRGAIPFLGEGMTADAIQELCDAAERESLALEAAARTEFEAAARDTGLPMEDGLGTDHASAGWEVVVGLIADHAGRRARLADLVVVPKPEGEAADARGELLNEVLFRAGRPLLMVPDAATSADFSHAVVAWNGRAEVARALAEALPLMHRAAKVTVLALGEEHPDRPSLDQVRCYLLRHGIDAATVSRDAPAKREMGQALLGECAGLGGDLLVIGGYSHNRWREMVLGGVTRTIVADAQIPVFMSH
ncbi:hypothetical protein CCR85_06000 [Rhodothalassium salexigens]|uniref:universal stress protein n=1 Tax=Rhodothalassium salexigens TaxID=1086 RepID=UPI0019134BC1|nr:universal stress protein [Rhodothalassium salexigens]MBK5911042.1 hypothetical protein [Rhodothalassium salexigens]